jgi:hypothetical protein
MIMTVLVSVFALTGCRFVSDNLNDLLPAAPMPEPVASSIKSFQVTPSQLGAGHRNDIDFSFDFEDLNADVGPDTAQVIVETRVVSGNIRVNETVIQLDADVQEDPVTWGQEGTVSFSRTFNVPSAAVGAVEVSVRLIDNLGNESNTLSQQIPITGINSGGGGVGVSGQQCTITDGSHNTTTVVRVGRQIFFRVVAPNYNHSSQNQDIISFAAVIESGGRGDYEPIQFMFETGANTGVFEGPAAGLSLVSYPSAPGDGVLSVYDRDTVIAFYDAPNGFGDICIALAKVN